MSIEGASTPGKYMKNTFFLFSQGHRWLGKKRNPTSFSRSRHNLSRIPPAPPLNTQKSSSEVGRQCFEGHSLFLAVCDEGTTLRVRTIETRQDTSGKTRNALQVVTLVNSGPPKICRTYLVSLKKVLNRFNFSSLGVTAVTFRGLSDNRPEKVGNYFPLN